MSIDVHSIITDQIVTMLEQGVVPWRSPILAKTSDGGGWPKNLERNQPYRGVNVFLLAFTAWAKGYASPYWATFNQAKARGSMVKKGEKSTMVVFWKPYETTDKETGKPVTVPVLRYYNVFNIEQCEGLTPPSPTEPAPAEEVVEFTPSEIADALARGYEGGPAVSHRGTRAFYRPLSDEVQLPEPVKFRTSEDYYSTLFHELAHSTGHSSRLDRGIDTNLAPFGSPDYGREELVAEMAAAFLCGHAGIAPVTIEGHAAYLQGWISTLKGDKRLVIAAAGAAQKATDWIRGTRPVAEAANAQD